MKWFLIIGGGLLAFFLVGAAIMIVALRTFWDRAPGSLAKAMKKMQDGMDDPKT